MRHEHERPKGRVARNCLTDEGRPLGCAKKKCKLHAVREMREGPSKPLCRERLQTATSCCGTRATVVNVVVKSVDRPRHVWMRETNASEPPIKHRNLFRRRQNRGLRGAPGSVWWKPVYWPDGVSEPLNSYSSHHGAMPRAHLPVGEQLRSATRDARDPVCRPPKMATQLLVFLLGPECGKFYG